MIDSIEASVGIYLATLIVSVLSGLVPIVNGEVYLVAAILVAGDPPSASGAASDDARYLINAIVLAVIVAVGQMIAKIGLYYAAKGAGVLGTRTRLAASLAKARDLVKRWESKPLTLLFVSALFGLPPFYLVSLLAGLVGIRLRTFLLLGIVGRVIRFVALALLVLYW